MENDPATLFMNKHQRLSHYLKQWIECKGMEAEEGPNMLIRSILVQVRIKLYEQREIVFKNVKVW